MNRANPSWQSFVPPSVSLYYVDHREDLDKHENLQEQCIRKNNLDAIHEAVFDWYMEQERENLTQTIDEIEKKMSEDGRYEEFLQGFPLKYYHRRWLEISKEMSITPTLKG